MLATRCVLASVIVALIAVGTTSAYPATSEEIELTIDVSAPFNEKILEESADEGSSGSLSDDVNDTEDSGETSKQIEIDETESQTELATDDDLPARHQHLFSSLDVTQV